MLASNYLLKSPKNTKHLTGHYIVAIPPRFVNLPSGTEYKNQCSIHVVMWLDRLIEPNEEY